VSYKLVYRPDVILDLAEAADWYERQAPGLGDRFLKEYSRALRFIRFSAESPRKIFEDFRRVLLKKFPFAVWYEVKGKAVVILLVWDCRQDPRSLDTTLRSR